MLEIFNRPEYQNQRDALEILAVSLSAALYDHYEGSDDFKVSHLGITDSLEIVLPSLLERYRLKGIHISCESNIHNKSSELIGGEKIAIYCLVFVEKNSEYVQYHLSYLARTDETMTDIAAIVDAQLKQTFGAKPEWVERSATSYRCKYDLAKANDA